MKWHKIWNVHTAETTRYCEWRNEMGGAGVTWFRSLHNFVYIKYVHNEQNFGNSQNSIEIRGNLKYSIYHSEKIVGRNNIFSINCDRVFSAPQDVVSAVAGRCCACVSNHSARSAGNSSGIFLCGFSCRRSLRLFREAVLPVFYFVRRFM